MRIYKAPQILIIHFKRFKNSAGYFNHKLESKIECSLKNMNLQKYIACHGVPN